MISRLIPFEHFLRCSNASEKKSRYAKKCSEPSKANITRPNCAFSGSLEHSATRTIPLFFICSFISFDRSNKFLTCLKISLNDLGRLSCKILRESCNILLKKMHLFKRSCEILTRSCKTTSSKDHLSSSKLFKNMIFCEKKTLHKKTSKLFCQ